MKRRLPASLIVLLTILFLPYWIYLPLLFVAMILFPLYWEGLVFGFLIDVLYGPGTLRLSLLVLVVLILLLPIRERLRWQI